MAASSKRTGKSSSVSRTAAPVKLPPVDLKTHRQIVEFADQVAAAAEKRRDPHLDIPTRSLSNVRFNKSRKIIEMGPQTNRRQLFNLSQAKSYMQTLPLASADSIICSSTRLKALVKKPFPHRKSAILSSKTSR